MSFFFKENLSNTKNSRSNENRVKYSENHTFTFRKFDKGLMYFHLVLLDCTLQETIAAILQ